MVSEHILRELLGLEDQDDLVEKPGRDVSAGKVMIHDIPQQDSSR